MIDGIDHLVFVCGNLEAAKADYSALLGREPDWHAIDNTAGTATVLFRVDNMAVELFGPHGEGPVGAKLQAMVQAGNEGLSSIAFSCADIEEIHNKYMRLGLFPSDISEGKSEDIQSGKQRIWRRIRLDTQRTQGVRHFIIENGEGGDILPRACGDDCVSSLDHVVINSPNADRAAALYGARLGAELRLDLERPDLASHFQFFRVGAATLEVVSRIGVEADNDSDDTLWGVSWSVKDIKAAHERVKKAGFRVTDIRSGRKNGSLVFTVLDRTCNTPTLFIQQPTQ
ncbi:VOC family protein [Hirschia litorea]|uniref:VOC family protein n=1 Tax=Hirschia litorea TaxID=1199156 RepID=A0ABW2IK76_9PROT